MYVCSCVSTFMEMSGNNFALSSRSFSSKAVGSQNVFSWHPGRASWRKCKPRDGSKSQLVALREYFSSWVTGVPKPSLLEHPDSDSCNPPHYELNQLCHLPDSLRRKDTPNLTLRCELRPRLVLKGQVQKQLDDCNLTQVICRARSRSGPACSPQPWLA